jgi:hypothetical protein
MVMGGQTCQACDDLRVRLRALGAPIGTEIEPVLERVLAPERLDERLRAFSVLRRELADRASSALAADPDPVTRDVLATLREVQLAQAGWADRRAAEFAATRVAAEAAPGEAIAEFGAEATTDGARGPMPTDASASAPGPDRAGSTPKDMPAEKPAHPAEDATGDDRVGMPPTQAAEGTAAANAAARLAPTPPPVAVTLDPGSSHPRAPEPDTDGGLGLPAGSRGRRARRANGEHLQGADPDGDDTDTGTRRVRR